MSIPTQSGRFYRRSDLNQLKDFRKTHYKPGHEHEANDQHGVRRAEEFDIKLLAELTKIEGCSAVRVCYGLAPETDYAIDIKNGKQMMPRILLIPIDKEGNELSFSINVTGEKDAGSNFGGIADGIPCPPKGGCQ